MSTWEVHAVKYAEQLVRKRAEHFIFTDNHEANYPIDYFMWVLRRGDEVILVDTGFDKVEADHRGREVLREPDVALAPLGLKAADITQLIVTHLHFDHAGGLHLFPNATIHLQAAEMAYATGPCMCHDVIRYPFTADHVCEAVRRVYSGRCIFHDGDGEVAEGVTVHCIGGHSRGMQCVRVRTEAGWLVLASDASHFYENIRERTPFLIVVDLEDMMNGFDRLEALASSNELVVPGHDPLVTQYFPQDKADYVFRLDKGPIAGSF